jgi:hypothetical protein
MLTLVLAVTALVAMNSGCEEPPAPVPVTRSTTDRTYRPEDLPAVLFATFSYQVQRQLPKTNGGQKPTVFVALDQGGDPSPDLLRLLQAHPDVHVQPASALPPVPPDGARLLISVFREVKWENSTCAIVRADRHQTSPHTTHWADYRVEFRDGTWSVASTENRGVAIE